MREGKEKEKKKKKTEGTWLQCALTPLLRNFECRFTFISLSFPFLVCFFFLSITSQPILSPGHNLVNGKKRTLVSLLSQCLKGNEGKGNQARRKKTDDYSL